MRVRKELVVEAAQSWARLREVKNSEWFIHDLEELMRYDRKQHMGVAPSKRGKKRADQANGFYSAYAFDSAQGEGVGGAAQPLGLEKAAWSQ